jgi:16S rRNA processing protein RimM
MPDPRDRDRLVVMGRIGAPHGVHGWVRVFSETRPREALLGYSPWHLKLEERWQVREVLAGHPQGKALVVHLAGCEDRDDAARLTNVQIAVPRGQLPEPAEDEYYWTDLYGLRVLTLDGVALGVVDHLLETGANDVLVVRGERERLIPFVEPDVVRRVDLGEGVIRVDWHPDD